MMAIHLDIKLFSDILEEIGDDKKSCYKILIVLTRMSGIIRGPGAESECEHEHGGEHDDNDDDDNDDDDDAGGHAAPE